MTQSEIQKRNLLSTITECFEEHQVELRGSQGIVPMYLIEVGAFNPLFQDFIDTFGEDVDDFKKKLAEKFLGQNPSNQMYGVFVNKDLQYVFAFNRQFADLDKQGQKIAFKSVEEIILENCLSQDLSEIETYGTPDFDEVDFEPGTIFIRYSITGKKAGQKSRGNKGEVSYEKSSLLDRVKTVYSEKEVELKTNDGSKPAPFFLVTAPYETSRFVDFMRTYEGEVDVFKERLARKIFGDRKVENQYGLLLTPDLEIKFAFNKQFGRYDPNSKSIVYIPAEEVLIEQTQEQQMDLSQLRPNRPSMLGPRRSRGKTIIRYALQGK